MACHEECHSRWDGTFPIECSGYHKDDPNKKYRIYCSDIICRFIHLVNTELFSDKNHTFTISPKYVEYGMNIISEDELARTIILEWREK